MDPSQKGKQQHRTIGTIDDGPSNQTISFSYDYDYIDIMVALDPPKLSFRFIPNFDIFGIIL